MINADLNNTLTLKTLSIQKLLSTLLNAGFLKLEMHIAD